MNAPVPTPKTIRQIAGIEPVLPALSQSILLMIDQQYEYVDGALQLLGIEAATAANVRLLAAARAAGSAIIHIAQVGSPGGMFDRAARRGSIIADVAPIVGEPVVEKRFASAFAATTLDEVLSSISHKSMIIVGYMTHNCVTATSFDAVVRGYAVTIVADATATRDLPDGRGGVVAAADLQRAQLAGLSDRQAVITTVDEVLAAQ